MQRIARLTPWRPTLFSCLTGCLLLLLNAPVSAGLAVGENITISRHLAFDTAPAVGVNASSGEFLSVWSRNDPDPAQPDIDTHEIIGRRIGADGVPAGPEFVVSTGVQSNPGLGGSNPAIVYNSVRNQFLVVYQRDYAGSVSQGIFAQRLDHRGLPIDTEIFVQQTPLGDVLSNPAVAYNPDDDEYLIVWESFAGILIGRRISATGVPNALSFSLSQQALGEHHPALVYNPTAKEFFVAFDASDPLNPLNNTNILAQKISPQGNLLGAPIEISTVSARQSRPIITHNPTTNRYAVIWQDERNVDTRGLNAFARIVNADGTLVGTADVHLADHALAPTIGYSPAERLYQVNWIVQDTASTNNGRLFGQFRKPDLAAQSRAFPISEAGRVNAFPALAVDPSRIRSTSLSLWPKTVGVNGSDIFGQVLDLSFKFTDLTLSVTAPESAPADQVLTYKLAIKNTGTFAATEVTLTDTLPTGTVYKSDSAGCNHDNAVVTCKPGDIAAGKSANITLKVIPVNVLGLIENKAVLDWANRITPVSETTELTTTTITFPGKLRLLLPNGGELLTTGSTYPISWEVVDKPSNLQLNYKLSLSLDNGQSWSVIAKNLSGESYDWTPISSKNSKKCLIKVQGFTDTKVADGSDRSDTPFSLEVMRLVSPNGGETLANDQMQTVTWITHATRAEVDTTRLRYSIDGGQSWKLIERLSGNPGAYPWTPPVLAKNTSQALLEVTLLNKQGKSLGSDRSDRAFAIEALKLISPNGGETLKANTTHAITWITHNTTSPVARFKLFFSSNGGKSWKLIAAAPGDPESYNWTIPARSKPAAKCRLKVTLLNAKGKVVGVDVSDDNFIVNP